MPNNTYPSYLEFSALAAKVYNPSTDTRGLEDQIDRLVYGLYDLTDEEIAAVEKI